MPLAQILKVKITGGFNEGHLQLAEACDYYENKLG